MRCVLGALLFLSAATGLASAQTYPSGTVTMVIPFAAGGPTDVLGRIMAESMTRALGQSVVVENVGGAGGMTGSLRVAKSKPDGMTILVGTVGTHAQNQTLYAKPQYDAVADFDTVGLMAEVPLVLITKKALPASNLQEFIAHTQAHKTSLNYGSAGNGAATHLGCVLLNTAIGSQAAHVPYRGSGPAMNDLISGQLDYMCDTVTASVPQIQAGTVKAIAYLGATRSPVLPDLPTAREQGLKDFEAYTWNAIFVAKGTPPAIIKKLNEAMVAAMNDPNVKSRLSTLGAQLVSPERTTPEYLAGFVKSEIQKWAGPIKASGARVD